MKLQIIFLRCGLPEGIYEDQLGYADGPVSARDRAAMRQHREAGLYPKVELVYSPGSSLCLETARAIYPEVPAVVAEGFRPFDYGIFSGRRLAALEGDKAFQKWTSAGAEEKCPEGESSQDLYTRSIRAFREVINEMCSKGLAAAAVITENAGIGVILQRYCLPRIGYKDWNTAPAGGYITEYDTGTNAIKIIKAIKNQERY